MEKNVGPHDAHIPSEQEFLDGFMADGIPDEFLREKFAWFEGNHAWLNPAGKLKDFRVIVRSWWKQWRGQWLPPASREAGAVNGKESAYSIKLKIEAMEADILIDPANTVSGTRSVWEPTAEQNETLKKKWAYLKELKRRLTGFEA